MPSKLDGVLHPCRALLLQACPCVCNQAARCNHVAIMRSVAAVNVPSAGPHGRCLCPTVWCALPPALLYKPLSATSGHTRRSCSAAQLPRPPGPRPAGADLLPLRPAFGYCLVSSAKAAGSTVVGPPLRYTPAQGASQGASLRVIAYADPIRVSPTPRCDPVITGFVWLRDRPVLGAVLRCARAQYRRRCTQ